MHSMVYRYHPKRSPSCCASPFPLSRCPSGLDAPLHVSFVVCHGLKLTSHSAYVCCSDWNFRCVRFLVCIYVYVALVCHVMSCSFYVMCHCMYCVSYAVSCDRIMSLLDVYMYVQNVCHVFVCMQCICIYKDAQHSLSWFYLVALFAVFLLLGSTVFRLTYTYAANTDVPCNIYQT